MMVGTVAEISSYSISTPPSPSRPEFPSRGWYSVHLSYRHLGTVPATPPSHARPPHVFPFSLVRALPHDCLQTVGFLLIGTCLWCFAFARSLKVVLDLFLISQHCICIECCSLKGSYLSCHAYEWFSFELRFCVITLCVVKDCRS